MTRSVEPTADSSAFFLSSTTGLNSTNAPDRIIRCQNPVSWNTLAENLQKCESHFSGSALVRYKHLGEWELRGGRVGGLLVLMYRTGMMKKIHRPFLTRFISLDYIKRYSCKLPPSLNSWVGAATQGENKPRKSLSSSSLVVVRRTSLAPTKAPTADEAPSS